MAMPERIWAMREAWQWHTHDEDVRGENAEYIRADIAEARVKELEARLNQMRERFELELNPLWEQVKQLLDPIVRAKLLGPPAPVYLRSKEEGE